MKISNGMKELARTIIVVAILVAGVSLVSAWTAPTQAPPGGNVPAPVNVGALSQIKSGPLQVNGFRNIGNSIFDGSVGIGTLTPTQKLDVAGGIKIGNTSVITDGTVRFTGTDFEGRVGGVWKSLTVGTTAPSTCPTATHELFTSPLSGEMCIPKDTWADSASASVNVVGNSWNPWNVTAESRINASTGKREVRITSCTNGAGQSCTTGWTQDAASCKLSINDVWQPGCLVHVIDRYKARVYIGNLYGDLNLDPYVTKMFGPGAILAGANATYPIGSQFGPGTAYPVGSHAGSCQGSKTTLCSSAVAPGQCVTPATGFFPTGSPCSCIAGFRLMYRLDLFERIGGTRIHRWECIKN
ncbi:hypothetical protein L6251_00555 [Candidatus Parcubacteria bacterium]|nr:hypothetical protein [Patescibacteria group bacterium]MBU4477172.1 hypothetical protein [Patescibacteria group bacterium]MCG2698899.1 hypothetical protein [Candidatus Parcubacteria bacterium]